MARKKSVSTAAPVVRQTYHLGDDIARFFSYCPHPFAVQDMIVTIAAGNLISAEALPVYLLPHALLLHAVAPEPGVVDDVVRLVERMVEEYEMKDHGVRWWHPQGNIVARMVYGQCTPEELGELMDTAYIVRMYEGITNGLWKQLFTDLKGGRG